MDCPGESTVGKPVGRAVHIEVDVFFLVERDNGFKRLSDHGLVTENAKVSGVSSTVDPTVLCDELPGSRSSFSKLHP